ncbi:hypothetical protein N658DRAFT_204613 [Parathielavia hyrcaniae]|uniref:Uncharacterized protein n=1 Tax=Parathielavia hyrcaniae TaxID=113614 RepID=A0AAN6Q120_9PEZI|nr:hypothetical protein N658DRAFT_204613 [Parathielavia hyrcaniae]
MAGSWPGSKHNTLALRITQPDRSSNPAWLAPSNATAESHLSLTSEARGQRTIEPRARRCHRHVPLPAYILRKCSSECPFDAIQNQSAPGEPQPSAALCLDRTRHRVSASQPPYYHLSRSNRGLCHLKQTARPLITSFRVGSHTCAGQHFPICWAV